MIGFARVVHLGAYCQLDDDACAGVVLGPNAAPFDLAWYHLGGGAPAMTVLGQAWSRTDCRAMSSSDERTSACTSPWRRHFWSFTALYSNTQRAHEPGNKRDWVVIHAREDDGLEVRCTIVTEHRGPPSGRRVVRGREGECIAHYSAERSERIH